MLQKKLKHLFLGLYKMALSDNEVAPEELTKLHQIANEYGISNEEVSKILLDDTFELYLPETLKEKVTLLYKFTEMAWADGIIRDEEILMLKQVAMRYGFLKENADAIVKFFIDKVSENTPLEKVINEITQIQ